jgi:protein-tyrosine phosphatase
MTPPVSKIKLLFVCLGNICRSPTAEGIFRHLAREAGAEQLFDIDSAGTIGNHTNERADRRSEQAASRRGIDLTPHRARQVTQHDFEHYDYILAMDKSNLANLQAICPAEHLHKLALMMRYAPELGGEVPDPYFGGEAGFEKVLDMLGAACATLCADLLKQQSVIQTNVQTNA